MEQLELLWHLQEIDLTIAGLEKELEEEPLISRVEKLEDKHKREGLHLDEINKSIKDKQKEIKILDLNLQKANEEIKTLRRKLYGGEVSNVKELGTMEKKLELVEKDKDLFENDIIEQIEILEEAEKSLEAQKNTIAAYQKKLKERQGELKDKILEIQQKINESKLKRDGILKNINEDYLERYKLLNKRPDKKGVARVVNDICEGCRVFISSGQRGRLYNAETMLYCENCGRLLVRFREDIEREKNQEKGT